MKIIFWFDRLRFIVATYADKIAQINSRLSAMERVFQDRTDIYVDVSVSRRDPHTIIVAGSYKNNDYVQTFSVSGDDFAYFINMLKEMQRYGKVKRVDAPIGMKAGFLRDVFYD